MCEGGSNNQLNCAFGELISIEEVRYGLFSENSCAMPPINDPLYQECLADADESLQKVSQL